MIGFGCHIDTAPVAWWVVTEDECSVLFVQRCVAFSVVCAFSRHGCAHALRLCYRALARLLALVVVDVAYRAALCCVGLLSVCQLYV